MHIIQKRVLKRLSEGVCLRYTDIRPTNIESNQFSYHLKSLMRQGYVEKTANEYCLTTKGLEFCSGVNNEFFFVRAQPKIMTLIVCKNSKGECITYKRKHQPFIGLIGFPYGKIHMGESVQEAAERELMEKTGVTADLKQKGIMYLTVTDQKGDIIVHMLCHIFVGSHPKGEIRSGDFGKVMWMSRNELLKAATMPGVVPVLKIAERKGSSIHFEEHAFEHIKEK